MYPEDDAPHNRALEVINGEEDSLYKLIGEGEHLNQDFKFRIDSSLKIAKTMAAFANTAGGRLLIGVKDNGRIAGIDPEEEFYMVEGAATLYCKPPVSFETKVYQAEDKLVLEVYIPSSPERPHFSKDDTGRWLATVRQRDENFTANRVLLGYLRMKKPGPRKNLMAYGADERWLFDHLSQNGEISLSKFSRAAKIPLYKAEKTLSLFLKWEIIGWRATEKGIRFYLLE